MFDEQRTIDIVEITSEKAHTTIVIIYSSLIALIAMITDDLSLILGIYSSFCECFNDFFLPAVLAYCALKHKRYHQPYLKLATQVWFVIGLVYWAIA